MPQLALFEGAHVPRTAARDALWRGKLDEAHAQLAPLGGDATEEAADAARLEGIASTLPATNDVSAEAVHEAFASALAGAEPRGFLSDAEWFRVYAQRTAGALEAEPGRRFRGWLGAHYAFAAGEVDAARRAAMQIIECRPPGPEWIEAARLAFELGDSAKPREWIHTACLDSPVELSAEPSAFERCGVPALDAAPPLPPLPAPIEHVLDAARALEDLPGPWTRWAAVVGEIDRVLAPRSAAAEISTAPREPDPPQGPRASEPDRSPAGTEAGEGSVSDRDPARAFLAALRAARRSRERDRIRDPQRCSDRELRARRRMQRLCPPLFARYLHSLSKTLF